MNASSIEIISVKKALFSYLKGQNLLCPFQGTRNEWFLHRLQAGSLSVVLVAIDQRWSLAVSPVPVPAAVSGRLAFETSGCKRLFVSPGALATGLCSENGLTSLHFTDCRWPLFVVFVGRFFHIFGRIFLLMLSKIWWMNRKFKNK